VLLFTLAIALATTVVFALVPAIQASRAELATPSRNERGRAAHAVCARRHPGSRWHRCCYSLGTAPGRLRAHQNRQTGYVSNRVSVLGAATGVTTRSRKGLAIVERLLMRVQAAPGVESAA
jgi:hypothetical protein